MVPLASLWLPILAAAVLVFLASFVIHMVLPWHKTDYARLPDEERARAALRPLAIPPGDYMMPRPATMQDMKTPEFQQKMSEGPVAVLTVMPNGKMSMGKNLVQWFIYCIVVGFFAGYIASRTLGRGVPYMQVFQIVAVTAFLGYCLSLWQISIWYRRAWSTVIKETVDGAVYALITAGAFGWLWPR
jgi:uncharacterized membrane protein (DUF4010 family)